MNASTAIQQTESIDKRVADRLQAENSRLTREVTELEIRLEDTQKLLTLSSGSIDLDNEEKIRRYKAEIDHASAALATARQDLDRVTRDLEIVVTERNELVEREKQYLIDKLKNPKPAEAPAAEEPVEDKRGLAIRKLKALTDEQAAELEEIRPKLEKAKESIKFLEDEVTMLNTPSPGTEKMSRLQMSTEIGKLQRQLKAAKTSRSEMSRQLRNQDQSLFVNVKKTTAVVSNEFNFTVLGVDKNAYNHPPFGYEIVSVEGCRFTLRPCMVEQSIMYRAKWLRESGVSAKKTLATVLEEMSDCLPIPTTTITNFSQPKPTRGCDKGFAKFLATWSEEDQRGWYEALTREYQQLTWQIKLAKSLKS